MPITLFAGALRYLGLSQTEAAEMIGTSEGTIKHWGSGRRAVPPFAWDRLGAFARRRDELIAAQRSLSLADAETLLGTMEGTGSPDFPCADSYVTMLAAAALTSPETRDAADR